VAEALVRLGDHDLARTMLARLLDELVSSDGDTVDSGRHRPASAVELDQNGELLTALRTYVDWTGDLDLVASRWSKVQALATFPLHERFRHAASGLLHNRREYWERHSAHGIEDGFELMHQFFVTLGFESAAHLANALGQAEDRDGWTAAAARLRHAVLEDPRYRLIEDGHFIKRRGLDGTWQRTIHMASGCGLPESIPLLQEGPHFLDPDTSSILPVAHAFIDPKCELARNTLVHIEELWNQWWEEGGYGRYHASSEPDSPGAWPFASLFVARAYAEAGDDAKVWRVLRWLAGSPGGAAGTWFENDGPRIAPPYPQVGIPPWTWAELITLYVHHLLGVRPDHDGVTIRPHLLEGLDSMEASLRVRECKLDLSVRRAGSLAERGGRAGSERLPWRKDGVRLPLPTADLQIEILC
jgi:GH15 family glucan-1,4-alpha-glucosidase